MGYGRGLHDALSEVHKRALTGDIVDVGQATDLVKRHLHLPFAFSDLKERLVQTAVQSIQRYIATHQRNLHNTIHSEKKIQVHIGDGIVIDGRIDLIKKLDTGETAIVDFKSKEAAQTERTTLDQLHVYALGYAELTGEKADVVEILNLDEAGKIVRTAIDDVMLDSISSRIDVVGNQIRTNDLPKHKNWCGSCDRCDFASLCRTRPQQIEKQPIT
jgi:DNA helicase-2/ATP-dependent DNA helicase PcrA